MKLLIVESPAKAKTIEKYLSGDYKVKASVGHIRDLPKSNRNAIDIENGFIPNYEVVKGKEKIISDLKNSAKGAEEIILATDLDREGEAIAWHIAELLDLQNPRRIVFHEITPEAVREALAHPRGIDTNLRRAQEARRVLDRLFGYDLSGLIWKKVRYGLSAGRVQSPALRILVEREREIQKFIPQKYFVLSGLFETKNKEELKLVCEEEPKTAEEAGKILELGRKGVWQVSDVQETETKRAPRPPFITSTLQQTASSRLGFSPARTMRVAQRLYEKGHITYTRTDSTNLAAAAQEQILKTITDKFGAPYVQSRAFKTKSKNAQEAHEAIRPTHVEKENIGGTAEEDKLYELIRARALASQMADAKIFKTKIVANITGKKIYNFTTTGARITFDGWLRTDPASRGEETELPRLQRDDVLKLKNLSAEEKETQPPPRYTEAGLVKELEKRGIGRPSTYASIIDTLEKRRYAEKTNRALHPTDTGEVVSNFLEKNFQNYISDTFTAEMENELDEIAGGKRGYEKTLSDFYNPFRKEVQAKENIEKLTNLGEAEEKCPKCGGKMIVKLGRTGKFLSCVNFPNCDGSRTMDGREIEGPRETGEKCPECKEGKLVERDGKFGKFTACSRYPKCKFIKQNEEELKKKMTDVACSDCSKSRRTDGRGKMMERRGRFGIFYSCSNYPDCKFAIKAKPTGQTCGECGAMMMEDNRQRASFPERCSNRGCKNYNPERLI